MNDEGSEEEDTTLPAQFASNRPRNYNNNTERPKSSKNQQQATPVKMRKIVVKSALCVIPDTTIWDPIQAIRKEHDKAYPRWMPHINLLYPFFEEAHFQEVAEELKRALADTKSFQMTFKSFDFFTHKSSSTLWLRAHDDALQHLEGVYAKVAALYPDCAKAGPATSEFQAHLSVGQWANREIHATQERYNETWKPLTCQVGAVYLISRHGFEDPFEIRQEIPLKP